MSQNIKNVLDSIELISNSIKDDFSEEDLRALIIKSKFPFFFNYTEIGVDIKFEKSSLKNKITGLQCLDKFGNTIVFFEFKRPTITRNDLLESFSQLWKDYVIPLRANYAILTQGHHFILFKRTSKNETVLINKEIPSLNKSDIAILEQIKKPVYNTNNINDVNILFNQYFDNIEKIKLDEPLSKQKFIDNFQFQFGSIFFQLFNSLFDYFQFLINKSPSLSNSFNFWKISFAKKPDQISKNWNEIFKKLNISSKDSILDFMFCLETTYSLFTKIMLIQACEDYKFKIEFLISLSDLLSTYSDNNEIIKIGWLLAIQNILESMKSVLIESVFEEDIFDWWNTELQDYKTLKIIQLKKELFNEPLINFNERLSEIVLNIIKYDFSELAGDPIGDLYQNFFDKMTRKSLGEFYTPIEVVDYILDSVNYDNKFVIKKNLIDPSCGSGTFIVGALKRYLQFTESNNDSNQPYFWSNTIKDLCLEFRIVGLDIHPFAVIMSQMHYMLTLIPYYKKALEENENFVIKRIPIFRTDSLWDISKDKVDKEKKLYKYITEKTDQESLILKVIMPIRISEGFLAIKITIPKLKYLISSGISNNRELFLVYQAFFDFLKHQVRENKYAFDKELFIDFVKQYVVKKNWNHVADKFEMYIQNILDVITESKNEFSVGRLIKSIEDAVLSSLLKNSEDVAYDFVVGNPPYVNIRRIDKMQKEHYEAVYYTANGSYDLYCLFIEKAISLLDDTGKMGYITSNQFLSSDYGTNLRNLITNNYNKAKNCVEINEIIDFRDSKVFSDVIAYPCILILSICQSKENTKDQDIVCARVIENINTVFDLLTKFKINNENEFISDEIDIFKFKSNLLTEDIWTLMPTNERQVFDLIYNNSKLKLEDITEKIFVGTQTSLDKVYLVKKRYNKDQKVALISPNLDTSLEFEIERNILKPILKGKDVSKWVLNWSHNWLIFPYQDENKSKTIEYEKLKKQFPLATNYFNYFSKEIKSREKGVMKKREDWYGFIYPKNQDSFEQPKLISQLLSQSNRFAFDSKGEFFFVAVGGNCITLKPDYLHNEDNYFFLLGLLNSSLLTFILKHWSPVHDGGFYLYIYNFLKRLPLIIDEVESTLKEEVIVKVKEVMDYLTRGQRIINFPNEYVIEFEDLEIEYETFELVISKNVVFNDLQVKNSENGLGFDVKHENSVLIHFETEIDAFFYMYSINNKKFKKKSKILVNIPKNNQITEKSLEKYRNDLNLVNNLDINKLEDKIDEIIYTIYNLDPNSISIIKLFNKKY